MFNPKVTIVIPVYNGVNYLKEAIDSAINQDYKNLEIVVVNDGSTDNTEQICLAYGNKIRYFTKSNGGVASALNLAIQKAQGDYISWLSHDDLYYPNKISRQIEVLEGLEDKKTIIYSGFEYFRHDNGIRANFKHEVTPFFKEKIKHDPVLGLLFWEINGLSLLIHTSILLANSFKENLKYIQDYDLWYRIFKIHPRYYIPDILTSTRVHAQQTGNNSNVEQHKMEFKLFYTALLNDIKDTYSIKDPALYYIIISYFYNMVKDIETFSLLKPFLNQLISQCLPKRAIQYITIPGNNTKETRLVLFNKIIVYSIYYK